MNVWHQRRTANHNTKWKWRDIRMVTHTQNLCSAINPSKVSTHTAVSAHTHREHTRSSGQAFMQRHPGSSWGFCALLKGTSVVVLRIERALDIHSPHLRFRPARDSNSQPLDYESDSLTIRPWLQSKCDSVFTREPARFKTLLLKVKRLKNMRNLNAFPLKYLSMKEDK